MPTEFPEILKDFTRECLRHQPDDICEFAVRYFDQKCHGGGGGAGLTGDEMSLDEIETVIGGISNIIIFNFEIKIYLVLPLLFS